MTKKYRLLQINTVCNYGSTGHIAEEISQNAIENGWESYIAYARYHRKSSANQYIIGNRFEISLHGILTRMFDMQGLASWHATKHLLDYIENIKPDVIQLHNIHGYYLNYPILFSYFRKKEIPIVWTFHDCWPITGHCVYFTAAKCNKWQSQCYDCPLKRSYPKSYIIDGSKRNYRLKEYFFTNIENLHIVTVSDWLKGVVQESFLENKAIETIHNGVDINVFHPSSDYSDLISKYNIPCADFTILGVANVWEERKGIGKFVKLRKCLDERFCIILVGLTEKQIHSLPEGIVGIQRTDLQQELSTLYSYADVFINMSIEETLGMTTIESMACGTPVIVNDSTACAEPLGNGCGYKIADEDLSCLLKCIYEIKKLGKNTFKDNCRKNAVERFDKIDCYKKYINLYNSLIS